MCLKFYPPKYFFRMNKSFLRTYWKSGIIVLIIFVLSVYPFTSDMSLPRFPFRDKVIHALMYVALAFVLYADYTKSNRTTPITRSICYIVFLFPFVYGGFIEIIQGAFFSPRTAEWLDWVADIAGSAVGFISAFYILKKTNGNR